MIREFHDLQLQLKTFYQVVQDFVGIILISKRALLHYHHTFRISYYIRQIALSDYNHLQTSSNLRSYK